MTRQKLEQQSVTYLEDLSRILILDKSGKTPLVNIWLTDEVYFGGVTLAFHLLIWKVKMLEKQQN